MMRRILFFLILLLSCALPSARTFAADTKWLHATSAHFDMYAAEGEGDPKAALLHLESVRAYFLAATHSNDPGGQAVRVVVFHSEGDFTKYRPTEAGAARVFTQWGAAPATIVALGLKPEIYEQVFREYTQLVLDESAPTLPYWFRAGLSEIYSTLKPADGSVKLGSPPVRGFKAGGISDGLDLTVLMTIDRAGILSSRGKQSTDFYTETISAKTSAALGNGTATTALNNVSSQATEDYAGAAWMLTHMLMFQQDYRPKFGVFLNALGTGTESGAAFTKIYGRSLSQVANDLKLYAKQPALATITMNFKSDKPAAAQVKTATKDETDKVFDDLSRKPK